MIERKPFPSDKRFINLIGQEFGRLVVIGYAGKKGINNLWICNCSCDKNEEIRKEKTVLYSNLKTGGTKSCGCYNKEVAKKNNTKFGYSKHPLYQTWLDMKSRCNDQKNKYYKDYGGRGITYCKEWEDFAEFAVDMISKPLIDGYKYSIDRIDNNKGYYFENCRWATKLEQSNNSRKVVLVEYNGEKISLRELSRRLNIENSSLMNRLKLGWSIEKIISTSFKKYKPRKSNNNLDIDLDK